MTDDERRTLALLEANHAFPGAYPLTVIALNSDAVTAALLRAVAEGAGLAAPLDDAARECRPSSGGKYLSHRLAVPCAAATDVVRLYAQVRKVDGVVTVL